MEQPLLKPFLQSLLLWGIMLNFALMATRLAPPKLKPPETAVEIELLAAPPPALLLATPVKTTPPPAKMKPVMPVPKTAPVHKALTIQKPAAPPITNTTTTAPVEPQMAPPNVIPAPVQQNTAMAPMAAEKPALTTQNTDQRGQSAKVIYQPAPEIPEDLRREAYDAFAMVRFHIQANGQAEVELVTPSQNPRLNAILLETLASWRFQPARYNGQPVAATLDMRINLAVE